MAQFSPFFLVCVCVCLYSLSPISLGPNTKITQEDKATLVQPTLVKAMPSIPLLGEEGGSSSLHTHYLECMHFRLLHILTTSVVSTFMSDALGLSPLPIILSRASAST